MTTPRRRSTPLLLALALGAGTAVLACDPFTTAPSNKSDLALVLRDLGRVVAVPTYFYVDVAARALAAQLRALELDPTAVRLAAAQSAWRTARERWMESLGLVIGPPETLGFEAAIDFTPSNPARVELAIAGGAASEGAVDSLGASQKGFLSLEYLLFDPEGGSDAVVARLSGEAGAPRRAFARALGENLAKKTGQLHDLWAGNALAAELERAGQGSQVFGTQSYTLGLLLNRLVFVLETAADAWLGKLLGARSGGVPVPGEEIARRSDQSLTDLVRVVQGVGNVLRGRSPEGSGISLYGLLTVRNPTLAERLRGTIDAAVNALLAIPPPLRTAVLTAKHIVEGARTRILELNRFIATELTGVFAVSLTFTANDGD